MQFRHEAPGRSLRRTFINPDRPFFGWRSRRRTPSSPACTAPIGTFFDAANVGILDMLGPAAKGLRGTSAASAASSMTVTGAAHSLSECGYDGPGRARPVSWRDQARRWVFPDIHRRRAPFPGGPTRLSNCSYNGCSSNSRLAGKPEIPWEIDPPAGRPNHRFTNSWRSSSAMRALKRWRRWLDRRKL
jgi:hypothetical protein